jgi:endonuclease-3
MTPVKVKEFFARLKKQNPAPRGELEYTNPYTLLVAVVLSAQATDTGVNKATRALFKTVKKPEDMVKLGEAGLKDYIRTIGLYNAKAKNIIALSRLLVENHKSKVPETREELVRLPGVGRKTANVVLNIAFGQLVIAVDTHLFRVGNRTGLAPGKTPEQVEQKLLKTVPKDYLRQAHTWLILHGRYVCKARRPECPACVVRDLCAYRDKTE